MNIYEKIRNDVNEKIKRTKDFYDIPRLLDILIDQVFIRSGRLIMELIQNAEDACMEGKVQKGMLRIELHKDKLIVMHNGKPFDEEDLYALCGLRSRKKPEKGYLGYLGIGFKSVFKVSDKVIVYSRGQNKYCFKFDRKACSGEEWRSIPIEIPEESLEVTLLPYYTTMFIIYLKSDEFYEQLKESLDKLRYPVFLFLRYLKEVEIKVDGKIRKIKVWSREKRKIEEKGEDKVESGGDKEYSELLKDLEIEEVAISEDPGNFLITFLVFSKSFNIPDEIRNDEITKIAKRENVKRREVRIAFKIKGNKLEPIEEGETISGFYSFLPVEEAKTGLNFLIQADIITQAGREQLLFNAKWNKWMMERVADVIEGAIRYFQMHPEYCKSYIPIFEIKEVDNEFYKIFTEQIIKNRIDKVLKNPLVPTPSGKLIPLSKAVKLTSEVRELVENRLIKEEDLSIIFEEEGLKFIAEDVETGERKVRKLTIDKLFNERLIKEKGVKFLIELYKYLSEKGYLNELMDKKFEFLVIDENGDVVEANECYFKKQIPKDVKKLIEKYPEVKSVLKEYRFVHDELEKEISDILKKIGVKTISYKDICKKAILPKILVSKNKERKNLTKDNIIPITVLLKKGDVFPEEPIWVLTRNGEIKESDRVYFTELEINEINKYYDNIILDLKSYLDEDYDLNGWREFFRRAYVKPLDIYWDDFISIIKKDIERKFLSISESKKIIELTFIAKEIWKRYGIKQEIGEIKVLLKNGKIGKSSECYLSSKYKPNEDWERWSIRLKDYGFDIGPFLAEDYIEMDNDIDGWREFFKATGIKDFEDRREVIANFAEAFAKYLLKTNGYNIIGGRGKGYDLIAEKDGKILKVEVKGRKKVEDIALEGEQAEVALNEGENYCLLVVYKIPNDPEAYLIQNPRKIGETIAKITIKAKDITQEKYKLKVSHI